MLQCIKHSFTRGKERIHLKRLNSPEMFLGWIPEENYTWHMTYFFFFVGHKAKKKMMPSSRGNNLLESQQKVEKLFKLKEQQAV